MKHTFGLEHFSGFTAAGILKNKPQVHSIFPFFVGKGCPFVFYPEPQEKCSAAIMVPGGGAYIPDLHCKFFF